MKKFLFFVWGLSCLAQTPPPKTTGNTRYYLGMESLAPFTNQTTTITAPPSGYVFLYQTNNVLSYIKSDGSVVTLGVAGAGGAPVGTVVNTGASTTSQYPKYTDTTGTNVAPDTITLNSADFANQGTATTVLHGNAAGNPTWGAIALATDVSGTLQAAQFPALTGDITTPGTSLATTLKNTGTAGSYTKVTFDAQGRETSGATADLSGADVMGILAAGRFPALTGNVTTSVGSLATTIAAGVVTEAMQVLADNTTQNVSTSAHGYAPKAPNDATKFLNGVGVYAVPASGGAPVGTVVNTGASVSKQIPLYSDGTGTNVSPTTVFYSKSGDVVIPTIATTNLVFTNLASFGDVDLYVIPAGMVGVCRIGFYNTLPVTTLTAYPELKKSGIYYRIGASVSASATNVNSTIPNYVFNAGDTIAINTSALGLDVSAYVTLMSTNSGLSGYFVIVSNGTNAVYTAPSSKYAAIGTGFSVSTTQSPSVGYFNNSGASIHGIAYFVNSGDNPSDLNRVSPYTTVSASSTAIGSCCGSFQGWVLNPSATMYVSVDSGTATQYIFGSALNFD